MLICLTCLKKKLGPESSLQIPAGYSRLINYVTCHACNQLALCLHTDRKLTPQQVNNWPSDASHHPYFESTH